MPCSTFDARAHGESGGLFTLDGPRELAGPRASCSPGSRRSIRSMRSTSGRTAPRTVAGLSGRPLSKGCRSRRSCPLPRGPTSARRSPRRATCARESCSASRRTSRAIVMARKSRSSSPTQSPRQMFRPFAPISRLARRVPNSPMSAFRRSCCQGRRDFAFDADQALAAYRLLKGPKRLYLGDFGHSPAKNPPEEFDHAAVEVRMWFDRFLKGIPNGIDKEPTGRDRVPTHGARRSRSRARRRHGG